MIIIASCTLHTARQLQLYQDLATARTDGTNSTKSQPQRYVRMTAP